MRPIRLHPSLGTKVLERLREYADLPTRGVVAGQAVASVLDHLQGLNMSPINDIDVFRPVGGGILNRVGGTAVHTTTQLLSAQAQHDPDYSALYDFLKRMRSYRISTVSRQGMLNFVNCRLPDFYPLPALSVARVINSFDLNCVRVGVDLATEELVWDRHYQNFLKTRRIEISSVHTPWHTFLRALKKAKEIPGATFDAEAAASVVSLFRESKFYADFERIGVISDAFGPKLVETAKSLEGEWSKYFRLETIVLPLHHRNSVDLTVGSFKLRGTPDEKLLRQVNNMQNASLHFAGPVIHHIFKKASHKVACRIQELDHLIDESHPVIAAQFNQDPYSLSSGQVSTEHLDTVSRFLQACPEFCNTFAGLSLDEQFEASKALAAAKATLAASEFARLAKFAMPPDLRSQASVKALIARLANAAAEPLHTAALPLPRVPASWAKQGLRVKQLCSLSDFTSSIRFSEASRHVWGVRGGREAIVEITSQENGRDVTTALEFKLEEGKPVALSELMRPPGLMTAPARHLQMVALIQARLFGSPRLGECKVTCPEDDLPF